MTILAPEAEPATDAAGDIFDPELHATKPNGEPSLKTDGTFRKKRRDAGGKTSSASSRTKSTSSTAGGSKALQEQRERHVKGVMNTAAVVLTPLSFVSPVDAYTLSELTPTLAEALADYAPENPQVAAALDKLSAGGGLFAVLAVVGLAAVQVAHNHGKIPEQFARMVPGVKPLSETHRILDQRARAMAEQQAQGPVMADAA